MRSVCVASGVVLILLAGAIAAGGQGFQGGLRGAITDSAGAVIPGAAVMITNEGTNASRSTVSNDAGQYVFSALTPGTYKVTAELPGFKLFERNAITIGTQEFPIVDIRLEVGQVTDSVAVMADVPLIETSNASNGQSLPSIELETLPNPGRNAFIMAQTVPTVIPVGDPTFNRQQDQSGSSAISLAGGPVRGNNYTIDGVSVTDIVNRASLTPSIESVDEVKVQVNTFDAEMGRTGGGVFNTHARVGTNEWHGSALIQSRPGWGSANGWFANRAGVPLDRNFVYYLGGGSAGGPVWKNKTFFWFSTEDYKDETRSTNPSVTVPTLLQKQGDFSQTFDGQGRSITIYDPLTTRPNPAFDATKAVSLTNPQYIRDPFPGNKIPQDRMNTLSLALMRYWSDPTPGAGNRDGTLNLVRVPKLLNGGKQFTLKIDQNVTSKLSVSAFGAFQKTHEPTAVYYDGAQKIADPNGSILNRKIQVLALNATLTTGHNSIMSFRYGFSGFDDNNMPSSLGFDVASLPFSSNFLDSLTYEKFPSITVTGYRSLGDGAQTQRYYYGHNANVAVSRFMGRHSLRYGADFRRVGAYYFSPGQGSGSFTFNQNFTRLDPGVSDTRTGNAFASFLLGYPASASMTVSTPIDAFFRYYAGYLQDDFRLSPALTLNLGLRYEYEEGLQEKENRFTVGFDPNVRNPISDEVGMEIKGGLIFAGVNGAPTHQGNPSKVKFGPRAGFAWNTGKFVVRGGYGIFYAPEQYNTPSTAAWGAQGFTVTDNAVVANANGTIPVGSFADPFPNGYRQPAGSSQGLLTQLGDAVNFVDSKGGSGRVQQYTLDIQRELPKGVVVSAGYIGSWSSHLTLGGSGSGSVNIDQLPSDVPLGPYLRDTVPNPFFGKPGVAGNLGAQATTTRAQLLRPFPQFTSVNVQRVHAGFSRYNSMVLKVEKRSTNGLSIRSSWTWSKNLDNVFGESNFFADGSVSARNNYDVNAEYAYSIIDTPHRVIITPIYQLPFGQGRPWLNHGGWTDRVLGGWTLSCVGTFQTGFPIAITQTDNSFSQGGLQRPIRVLGVDPVTPGSTEDRLAVGPSGSAYINKDAYVIAPAFTFGTMARNIADIRTPSQKNLNVSLAKTTKITESVKLTFRLEANNATNTPKFDGPNSNLSETTFGTITSQVGFSRQLQWMARVHW
jgi:trimeric autotransporter adhesin